MELSIKHKTKYEYVSPIGNLIQTTKLYPSENNTLKIINWNVTRDAAKKSKIYTDGEANNIQNFSNRNKVKNINFTVNGKVETFDTKGIYKNPLDKINPLVYLRNTPLTESDSEIVELGNDAKNGISDNIEISHKLLKLVAERVEYKPLTTSNETSAIIAYNSTTSSTKRKSLVLLPSPLGKNLSYPRQHLIASGISAEKFNCPGP